MQKILLLSDTHGFLDRKIKNYILNSDQVWHAGDIGDIKVLNDLASLKPLESVYGNIDGQEVRLQTTDVNSFNCEGVSVLMLHIAGYPGRYNLMARKLINKYKPKLLICGHSHILKVMYDKKNRHLHMNPGAAGIYGFHKIRTMLRFEINKGKIDNLEAIELGPRSVLSNTIN
jgi:putative phosphoesterase